MASTTKKRKTPNGVLDRDNVHNLKWRDGKNILFLVDSDTKDLQMNLRGNAKNPGEVYGADTAAIYGRITSLQLGLRPDESLLPEYSRDDPHVAYGPLLLLIISLGKHCGMNADDIPRRMFVLTTDTLTKAYGEGPEKERELLFYNRLVKCFRERQLLPYIVLYGGGAAAVCRDIWRVPLERASMECLANTSSPNFGPNLRTFPGDEFVKRTSDLCVQATVLRRVQEEVFGLDVGEKFGSHFVHALEVERGVKSSRDFRPNEWICIVRHSEPVWEYLHDNKPPPEIYADPFAFEVIVSIWEGGLLKHVVLAVRSALGEKHRDGYFGMKLPQDKGDKSLLRGTKNTINVVIDVKEVVSSGGSSSDLEDLAKFQSTPKVTNGGYLVHLFPRNLTVTHFKYANLTFIARRDENNRKPQVLRATVLDRGEVSVIKGYDMTQQRKVKHTLLKYLQNMPQLLVKSCHDAFPIGRAGIHKSNYVVDATFCILAGDKFLPIAIGEAPLVIPCPHEAHPLHFEVSHCIAKAIARKGTISKGD